MGRGALVVSMNVKADPDFPGSLNHHRAEINVMGECKAGVREWCWCVTNASPGSESL